MHFKDVQCQTSGLYGKCHDLKEKPHRTMFSNYHDFMAFFKELLVLPQY